MLRSLRTFLRHVLSSCGHALGTLVTTCARRPPLEKLKNPDISVHLLVSSKTWHAGLLAAISFEFFTERHWNLFIHEDGSLCDKAKQRIEKVLPGVHFISRKQGEEKVKQALANYPVCLAHRATHNLFLKFFDIPLFAPGERFIFLDSDVLFYAKPEEIIDWADSGNDSFFYNKDTKEKYCIPRSDIQRELNIELWPFFNSGLMLIPKKALSWKIAEEFLLTFETTAHHPQFFEQTLYAVMASIWNQGEALPLTYEISWGFFRDRKSIARHYVGAFKYDILYLEGPLFLFFKMFFLAK